MTEKTEDLIAEAREACADRQFNGTYEAGLIRRLADALEARQPSEDDELANIEAELAEWLAGRRSWCDQHHGKPDEIELTAKADEATIRLLIVKRDALRAAVPDAATELAQAKADLKTVGEVSRATFDKLKAERDAALAAIERVRAAADTRKPVGLLAQDMIAALDGAPEPEEVEWEYEYADDDDPEGNVYGQFRRVVGPWLPVEGESKP